MRHAPVWRRRWRAVSSRPLGGGGLVVALILSAGLVAGCERSHVGAAAVVGQERISVRALQDEVDAFYGSFPAGVESAAEEGDVQAAVLNRLIDVRVSRAVAASQKINVTQTSIDELLAPFRRDDPDAAQFMVDNGFTQESLVDAAYAQLVRVALIRDQGEQAAQATYTSVSSDLGVWVSPRYGAWTGISLQPGSGSISVPASN